MKLPITIEYSSGEQATYVAQPPEWQKWEKQTGHTIAQAQEKWALVILCFLLTMHTNAKQLVNQSKHLMYGVKQLQM